MRKDSRPDELKTYFTYNINYSETKMYKINVLAPVGSILSLLIIIFFSVNHIWDQVTFIKHSETQTEWKGPTTQTLHSVTKYCSPNTYFSHTQLVCYLTYPEVYLIYPRDPRASLFTVIRPVCLSSPGCLLTLLFVYHWRPKLHTCRVAARGRNRNRSGRLVN